MTEPMKKFRDYIGNCICNIRDCICNIWNAVTKFIGYYYDLFAIFYAIFIFIYSLGFPFSGEGENFRFLVLLILAILIGLCYIVNPLIMLMSRRIEFDRHLMSGRLIFKVTALAVYVPLIIAAIAIHQVNQSDIFSHENQYDFNIFWGIYFHFTDPGNQSSASPVAGSRWAALTAMLGVFLLNGLLVSSIVSVVDRRKERWQNGEIRYPWRHLKDFAIVIGANEAVSTVIKRLLTEHIHGEINDKCEHHNDYVILQTCRDPQKVRTELSSRLTEAQLRKVVIYNGLRDSEEELGQLYPHKCTEIYILGESTLSDGGQPVDGGESFHDALNMRCANLIAKIISEHNPKKADGNCPSNKITCNVLFEYQTTYSIFQFSDVSKNLKKVLEFVPFNRYDSWARQVLVENRALGGHNNAVIEYTPLDSMKGITSEESEDHVHFVIVGMSKMGVAMGVQAMLQAHYHCCPEKFSPTRFNELIYNTLQSQ